MRWKFHLSGGAHRRPRRATRLGSLLAFTTITLGLGMTWGAAPATAAATPAFEDGHQSTEARVNDLLERMTLPEKIGQMDQIVLGKLRAAAAPANGDCNGGNNDPLQPACLQTVLIKNQTGSILSGGTDNPADNTGHGWAVQYNTIQQYAIQHSRLHIPIIYGVDAVHGFGHPFQATLFPQSIGMGATWDTALAQAAGNATRQQLVATGGNWDFAPVQDPARDTRWGRYYETWAEAPVLAAALGGANIRGMQAASSGSLQVAATVKHFAGYSESINGHDRVEAQLPIRYLQDTFLPSYAGGIDAGAATVMVNSGSVNGVPATASHFLLTDELRGRLGFKGVVISDYADVPALFSTYHIAADLPGAVAKAVNAGVDMAMEPFDSAGWDSALLQDVQQHLVSVSRIDESVRRILRLKFQLGLFDHPLVDPSKADAAITANQDLSRQAADESMTLLRNQGALPLSPAARVVVTGPNADSIPAQLGGWSVSWQGVFDNNRQACCGGPPDQIPPATTALKGIQQVDPNVVSVPTDATVTAAQQAAAVAAAQSADATIVVVGETMPYAEGLGDNPAPALPSDQQSLISALQTANKPVIVVVIAGRPLGLGPAAESANGVLMAYQPGTQGGLAVADTLFGAVNPGGKLPVTWPSDATELRSGFNGTGASLTGDQPKFFDQLAGTNSGQGSGYNPLYPFGFGLSYTTFQTSGLSSTAQASRNGRVTATFTVQNTGARAGTDTVPVYVQQPISDVLVPPQRLVGFARVSLDAGQSKVVHVSFPVSELAVTPGDIDATAKPEVEAGSYLVALEKLSAPLTITG
jgi:beta-glucosidase